MLLFNFVTVKSARWAQLRIISFLSEWSEKVRRVEAAVMWPRPEPERYLWYVPLAHADFYFPVLGLQADLKTPLWCSRMRWNLIHLQADKQTVKCVWPCSYAANLTLRGCLWHNHIAFPTNFLPTEAQCLQAHIIHHCKRCKVRVYVCMSARFV
jgi:hypothetical protein